MLESNNSDYYYLDYLYKNVAQDILKTGLKLTINKSVSVLGPGYHSIINVLSMNF